MTPDQVCSKLNRYLKTVAYSFRSPKVRRVYDPDDLIQEMTLQILEHIGRYEDRTDSAQLKIAKRIAINKAITIHRSCVYGKNSFEDTIDLDHSGVPKLRAHRRGGVDMSAPDERTADNSIDVEDSFNVFDEIATRMIVSMFLQTLTDLERITFELRMNDPDITGREIARMHGVHQTIISRRFTSIRRKWGEFTACAA